MSKKKGGPKTEVGKARSSRNAVKHGILGAVAPHEESAYSRHLCAVRENLAPVGYLEEVLSDRVALSLWRLGRVASFEAGRAAAYRRESWNNALSDGLIHRGEIAAIVERWGLGIYHTPETLQEEAQHLAKRATDTERLAEACRIIDGSEKAMKTALSKWHADERQSVGLEALNALDEHDVSGGELIGLEDGEEWDREDFAPDELVTLCKALGPLDREDCPEPSEWGFFVLALRLGKEASEAQRDAARLQAAIYEIQARTSLPQSADLEKVGKYEAHLERTLYRALHELEAMQARRQGEDTLLARLQVHDGQE